MDKITIYEAGRRIVYWVKKIIDGDPAVYEFLEEPEDMEEGSDER